MLVTCQKCHERQIEKIIAESKKAMKRYTKKLREEKYAKSK